MTLKRIEDAIPHRPPMRLIDEIVEQTETAIICRKTFREDEFFFQGHFPEQPLVPGVIQCECCLQAGAVLVSESMPSELNGVPVATRLENVKFKRMVRPGDVVEIHVTLNEQLSNAFFMTGKVQLNGKIATRLDFACSVANPNEASA